MHQQAMLTPTRRRARRAAIPVKKAPIMKSNEARRFTGSSRYGFTPKRAALEAFEARALQAMFDAEAEAPRPVRAMAVTRVHSTPARNSSTPTRTTSGAPKRVTPSTPERVAPGHLARPRGAVSAASNIRDFEPRSARRSKNARAARKLNDYSGAIGNIPQRAAVAAASAGLVALLVMPNHSAQKNSELSVERTAQTLPKVGDVTAPTVPQTFAHVQAQAVAPETLAEILEAAGGASNLTTEQRQGLLSHPVNPVRITSPFGNRPDPWGSGRIVGHVGQDYATSCGQPVYATGPGTVVQAESAGHSGMRVTIDHGYGLETAYSHNTSFKVKVGDKVDTGDVIALAGSTGNSTACHVHYEVIVDGEFTNPASWVGRPE